MQEKLVLFFDHCKFRQALELVHKFMNLMLFKAWITVMRTIMCFEHFRLMYTNTLQRRTHTPNKTNPSQGSVEHV